MMVNSSFAISDKPMYNTICGTNNNKTMGGTMASDRTENMTASETASGADLSALLYAHRVITSKEKLANLNHTFVFMTIYELCKGSPETGVDLTQLQAYMGTGLHRETDMPKSTFSRIVRTLSVNEIGFSFTDREKGFGWIEIFDLDGKRKAVRVTEAGHKLVEEITNPEKIKLERMYLDGVIDSVQSANDYARSEEMQKVISLFDQGYSYFDVEKRIEEWKKANPDKVYKRRGDQVLEMPVPEGVTEKWLEKYNAAELNETRQKMLKDAGLFADETMERLMYVARPKRNGVVTFTIPRDGIKNKDMQKRTIKLIERVREMQRLKEAGWDESKVKLSAIRGEALTTDESRKLVKTLMNPNSKDENAEKVARLESELADLKALVNKLVEVKDAGT